MARLDEINDSLGRTARSLRRLQATEKKLDSRVKKLKNALEFTREKLTEGRGQKIRRELTKATQAASDLLDAIDFLQTRAERISHKVRNLSLDIEHGVHPSGKLWAASAKKWSIELAAEATALVERLQPVRSFVRDCRSELKKASIRAEWHYKIDLCIDLFRAGYDELGLTRLLELCYGPDTPPDHRRRSINELLSWGHTVQDLQLIGLATNHLASYVAQPERAAASERELVLKLEGTRVAQPFAHESVLLLLIDATKRQTEDAILAVANLVSGLQIDLLPDIGNRLQLLWLNKALAIKGLEPIRFDPAFSDVLFDQVDCDVDEQTKVTNGPLVTVIVPAWNSEMWLPTAIRGLVKQSWLNLEIIIVDDCSDDATLKVARSLAKKDARIRVLANKSNRGAYASRNWALAESRGEYITVHDADDWSHPRKIERQVAHLQRNSQIVANLSQSVRIDQDSLLLFAQYGRELLRQNSSSLMFTRETVFDQLGFWDEVKFGADTEFHHRVRSRFGPDSAPIAKLGMLSLTRYHSASLTGGGKHSTQRGIVGARRDYLNKFDAWHARGKSEGESLYLERSVVDRPFAIPVSSSVDENNVAHFDLLVVANLSLDTEWLLDLYEQVRHLQTEGQRVAFLHLPGLLRPTQLISPEFEALISDGVAVRIYAENDCEASRILVQASSLAAANVLMPALKSNRVEVVLDDVFADAVPEQLDALAREYFGAPPVFVASNRETKRQLSQWRTRVEAASKVFKFE